MRLLRCPYVIDRKRPSTALALGFMALSAILCLIYYVVKPLPLPGMLLHLALPVLAALAFIVAVLGWGHHNTLPTVLSVVLGVVFFICKAATFAPLHRALCTVLYVAVLLLYTLTVLGLIPTKVLLYPLFSLPLLYHIFVEDTNLYFFAQPPVPVFDWFPELSVLAIIAALLCISVALKEKE